MLSSFFEIEEVNPFKPVLSKHELCEAHFMFNYNDGLADGRVGIRLPLKKLSDLLASTVLTIKHVLLFFVLHKTRSYYSLYVH